MKYSHAEYTDSRRRIEEAQQEATCAIEQAHENVSRATEAHADLVKKVRSHFRELAKDFNFTFVFQNPDFIDGPIFKEFEHEGHGAGTLALSLHSGTVSVADDDGKLHAILDSKGIAHTIGEDGQRVEMDAAVASERLEEALRDYRKRGERFPGQESTWEGRTTKRSRGPRKHG